MSNNETPLEKELKKLISTSGPISFAQYMSECLGHPKHGYYMNKDPFGTEGDFTTAPEVSQMFGEMLGMWIANAWQSMGCPASVQLIELGPGRGTLMADILRVLNIVPDLKANLSVHLVEMSPTLKRAQEQSLASEVNVQKTWHKNLSEIADGFSFIIANEFFDALPVHQFEKSEEQWAERCVGINEDGDLTPILAPASSQLFLTDLEKRNSAITGDILECSPFSVSIMAEISRRINENGGAGLIIDYGYNKTNFGDSLQAMKKHQYSSLLESPGEADITAHVNFELLGKVAKESGLEVFGPNCQGLFLKQLGIDMRAEKLSQNATTQQKQDIKTALNRLTNKDEMGELFKVISVQNQNQPRPVGFD